MKPGQYTTVICKDCKKERKVTQATATKHGDNYQCEPCNRISRQECKDAIAALDARKREMGLL
jgi:hypothetical protein